MRFYFKKLVRDKIVDNCLQDEKVLVTKWRELSTGEYRKELIRKVNEEASEIPLRDNDPRAVLEELADLQTVVDALRESAGVSAPDLRAAARAKTAKKGGFAKRHYIDYVELAEDSEWAEAFRRQPHKYAEGNGGVPKIALGVYRHTKSGKLYEVIGISLHTESEEHLVTYRPLYESDYELFVRPYSMFIEQVDIAGAMMPRFEKVDSEAQR